MGSDSIPPNSFGESLNPGLVLAHAFRHMGSKDSDILVLDV